MQAISQLGLSASDVVNLLVRQIGESGTLVMPAFPRYRESLDEFEYQSKEEIEEVWTYDVQRTPPWTGALPYALIKKKGSVRSRFPLNTVVAYGKNAEEMIRHELDLDGATPCGPNSAWGYCAKNNAKILMLGVDLAHNLTMIHVAEDCFEAKWPIDHWYRFRTFNVKSFGADITVRVRERRPIWSTCYAERLLNRDLFKERIARVSSLGSLSVISLNSSDLIKYLQTKNSDGYPYKFWRMIQKK
jgi:aminoglycoside 3-N-acetyltransferase